MDSDQSFQTSAAQRFLTTTLNLIAEADEKFFGALPSASFADNYHMQHQHRLVLLVVVLREDYLEN